MGAILSKITGNYLNHFYEIYDNNNNTLYVGRTTNFKRRKAQHKRNGYKNIKIILSVYCDKNWSQKIEQAYIDFLKPTDNIVRAWCCSKEPYVLSNNLKKKYIFERTNYKNN